MAKCIVCDDMIEKGDCCEDYFCKKHYHDAKRIPETPDTPTPPWKKWEEYWIKKGKQGELDNG